MEKSTQKSAALIYYAIGLKFDDDVLCCFCAESKIKKSEYPGLLLSVITTDKVDAHRVCKCGLTFGRPQAQEAAHRIIRMISKMIRA